MIISYTHKICILEKPKCATTAIRSLLSKPKNNQKLGKSFINNKTITSRHFNYYDFNYRHVNLNGAIYFLRHNGIVPESYTFVCVIRDPIDLFKSLFFFDLNRQNHFHIYSTPETLRQTPHYFQFTDAVFFNNYQNFNMKFFRLEEINKFEQFLQTYDITESLPKYNQGKNKKELYLSDALIQDIRKDFYIYDKIF